MPRRDLEGVKSPISSKLSAAISRPAESEEHTGLSVHPEQEAPASSLNDPLVMDEHGGSDRVRRPGGYKQVRLSAAEMDSCEETLRLLRRVFGVPVQHSEVDRALWSLLGRAEETIQTLERAAPKLVRPPTSDVQAKAKVEEAIAGFFLRVLKHYQP